MRCVCGWMWRKAAAIGSWRLGRLGRYWGPTAWGGLRFAILMLRGVRRASLTMRGRRRADFRRRLGCWCRRVWLVAGGGGVGRLFLGFLLFWGGGGVVGPPGRGLVAPGAG